MGVYRCGVGILSKIEKNQNKTLDTFALLNLLIGHFDNRVNQIILQSFREKYYEKIAENLYKFELYEREMNSIKRLSVRVFYLVVDRIKKLK